MHSLDKMGGHGKEMRSSQLNPNFNSVIDACL
jgi:hypothetical protein